jgi:hypothetical protein
MAMDAAQTLTALYTHAGLDLESNIAILREAARDGEAQPRRVPGRLQRRQRGRSQVLDPEARR